MPSLLGGAMVRYLIQMGVWCALATDVQPRERKTGCAWTDNRESSDASTRRRFRTPLDKGPVNGRLLSRNLCGSLERPVVAGERPMEPPTGLGDYTSVFSAISRASSTSIPRYR